jgi:transposase InsO family protein
VRYATDEQVKALLLAERAKYPAWGARKLCKRLERKGIVPPPERTANRILKRAGLVDRCRRDTQEPMRFERANPNELWQVDHKRAIHGRWARRTVPFVVVDDCTRYLVGLKALANKGLVCTWDALWELFGEFGLPDALLSDNDQIFHGRVGPSQFEARLMCLGIAVLHGRFYHPETQGKVERLNGTLERELLRDGYFTSAAELQAGFDRFRSTYNYERPHEALSMDVPGAHYRPSVKIRPKTIPQMQYADGAELRKVHKDGWISYKGKCIEVGCGLSGSWVEIRHTDYGVEIYYGPYRLQGRRPQDSKWTRDDKVGGRRRKR